MLCDRQIEPAVYCVSGGSGFYTTSCCAQNDVKQQETWMHVKKRKFRLSARLLTMTGAGTPVSNRAGMVYERTLAEPDHDRFNIQQR